MWSYSGDPASSERDQVRFYCQDVVQSRQLLSDEDIDFLLGQWRSSYNSPVWVAAVACEVIAGKFAGEVNVSADGVNVDQGSLQQKYNDLAASLRDQYHALGAAQAPDLTSLLALTPDYTIAPLTFGIGFQDNMYAGEQDYGGWRGPGHSPSEVAVEDPGV